MYLNTCIMYLHILACDCIQDTWCYMELFVCEVHSEGKGFQHVPSRLVINDCLMVFFVAKAQRCPYATFPFELEIPVIVQQQVAKH